MSACFCQFWVIVSCVAITSCSSYKTATSDGTAHSVNADTLSIESYLEEARKCYLSGDDSAYMWYEKAAKKGNAESKFSLGVMYLQGDLGREPNPHLSIKWFVSAALTGNTKSMSALSIVYSEATDIDIRDYAKAYAWWKLYIDRTGDDEGFFEFEQSLDDSERSDGEKRYQSLKRLVMQ